MIDYSNINESQTYSEIEPFTEERYMQFIRFMGSDNDSISILDIGCNTGRGGEILRKHFKKAKIFGLDVVQKRLDVIKAGIYDKCICESITNISLPVETFDFIVAGEIIEHIAPVDLDQSLSELKRLLKPNGKLLMTTPNPNSFLVKAGWDGVLRDDSHLSVMSIADHVMLLKKNGLTKIKVWGSGKASRFLPYWFPITGFFGSYLSISVKE